MTMLITSNRAESREYNDIKFATIALVESKEIIMKVGRILG
jgi:hypothetical protein